MEKGRKLPAPDFCNKEGGGKANPVYGKGALGNKSTGRMYYTGGDTEEQVTLVQMMLEDLGYTVGTAGADGEFGKDTEKAVKEFQKEHEDWGGEKLNVDGLVGPETADALNRAMVGRQAASGFYITPVELTEDFLLVTATEAALKKGVSLEVKQVKKARVALVENVAPESDEEITEVYNIAVDLVNAGGFISYEIIGSEGNQYSGTTDESGIICHENVPVDEYILTLNGAGYAIPLIGPDEPPVQIFVDINPPEPEDETDYSDIDYELPESAEDDSDSGQYPADGSDDANLSDSNTPSQDRDEEA